MATENNTIETKVSLDATQAQQEIVKLNAVAADSTKTLEERVAAKNKQTELQEKLNKQTIAGLEKQVKALTGVVGKEKELEKATKKLNATRIKTIKQETTLIKQGNSLQKALNNSKGAVNNLNNATGGLITSFTALAANPIVLVITALVGALKLLKEAFTSSQDGQDKWNKLMTYASTILGNFMDLVADLAEGLVSMFENPKKAILDFGQLIKDNIINRIEGIVELLPKLGTAISLVFKGKISEASKIAADAVGKIALGMDSVTDSINSATQATRRFISEQERELKIAGEIADARAEADRLELGLITERAEANRKRFELLDKAEQRNKFSAKERIAFLKEANKIEDDITKKEVEAAKLRFEAKVKENGLSRSSLEAKQEEARLKATIINLETARLKRQKTNTAKIVSYEKEAQTAYAKTAKEVEKARAAELKRSQELATASDELVAKAKADAEEEKEEKTRLAEEERLRLAEEAARDRDARNELDALEIERKRARGEDTLQAEIDLLIRKRDQELANAELTANERLLIEEQYRDAIGGLQKDQVAMSKAADAAMLESTIGMAAEAFGVQKEAAIAMSLIKAPEAIQNVWTQAAKKPTLPQVLLHGIGGTAMVVAPIVRGLANIKKAKMRGRAGSRVRGSGGGGGQSIPTGTSTSAVNDLSANNASNIQEEAGINSSAVATASANVQASSSSNIVFSEGEYNDFQDQVNFVEGQTTID